MASDLLGSMRVEIVGDNSKLDKSINTSKKNTEEFGKSATGLGTSLGKLFTGIGFAVVAKKLFVLGKQAENLFQIQETAEAKLDQTLKATGEAAGLTAEELKKMASELQEVTTVGDEATIGAQSLLLTFKDIGRDVFPRALESILDVSEAMGQDLKSSTIQIGKALNDPVAGLAALSRVGIQFTEDQKELIKGFVETGDKAAAQGIILEELESQFGGVARAVTETAEGVNKQLNNSYGDLLETIGSVISEGLTPYRKSLKDEIESVNQSIQAHILRKKALEGNATLVETLTLRQIEQEKAESALAQAMANVEAAESQVLQTRGLSSIQIAQITNAKQAAIEVAKETVKRLQGEVEATTRATEATKRQVVEEQNRLKANIELVQGIQEVSEEDDESTESKIENIEEVAAAEQEAAEEREKILAEEEQKKLERIASEREAREKLLADGIEAERAAAEERARIEEELQRRRISVINSAMSQIGSVFALAAQNAKAYSDNFIAQNEDEIEALEKKAETEEGLTAAEKTRLDNLNSKKKELAKEAYEREVSAFNANRILKASETGQAGAQAAIEAFKALAGIPIAGPGLGAAAAAGVGVLTATQIGLILQQPAPPRPKFADGGVIGGSDFVGDKVPILANSGEMIINRKDQADLMRFIKSGSSSGSGGKVTNNNSVNISSLFTLGNETQINAAAERLFPALEKVRQRRGA